MKLGQRIPTIRSSWNAGKESILTSFQTSFPFGPHTSRVTAVLNHYSGGKNLVPNADNLNIRSERQDLPIPNWKDTGPHHLALFAGFSKFALLNTQFTCKEHMNWM